VVSNNRVSVTGQFGIDTYMGSGCVLLGNNVADTNAAVAPIGLLWSNGCTVVGGNNEANVLDLGSDNTLVGVNNMQGNPPGPAIKEAIESKLELLRQRGFLAFGAAIRR
jgi:parallel beta-helix repeat protein